MKMRGEYERATQVVAAVIRRWDPYALVAGGCPPDEFDSEIASVVAEVPRIRSRADAADTLSRVFSSAFQPEQFRPQECDHPGAELYEALVAAGLITGSAE